jgi:dienelactone hydrolase
MLRLLVFCLAAGWLAVGAWAQVQGQGQAPSSPPAAVPEDPWTLTRDVALVSRWPRGPRMQEDHITGDLYRPRIEGRVPAAVVINSSGGVTAHTEINYARVLARAGMAALVVDSFRPRGVRRTGDDQNRVFQIASNADAIAGFRYFADQPWVDAQRIVVMGMSRGGEAALSAALDVVRRRLQASDVRFAAHVAISPGGCSFQSRDARTTGAPIFFMLSELDDGTPAMPCVEYIQRLRTAGNANIRWAVYPGVYHAHESTGGIATVRDDWTGRNCSGRFWRDDDGVIVARDTGERVRGNVTDFLFRTCEERGYTIGGDERVMAQSTADLLQFLRDVDVLQDAEARAVVPDCATIPAGIVRRNCERARNGWTGDLVALARAARRGETGNGRDIVLAVRLFTLAAARHQPQAEWELALLLSRGTGVARDAPRALALARAAAEAGDGPGTNVYGSMIRDGVGRASDDAEAAVWFQRATDLVSSYGMMNLGRFLWDGRGGLARDRAAATALWRRAIYQDGNPWAQLLLAQALESGEGVAADAAEARTLYQAAAAQDREPTVKRQASQALARLDQH